VDKRWKRREILKQFAAASTAMLLRGEPAAAKATLQIAGRESEIQIASVSAWTLRLSILPIEQGEPSEVPANGSLVQNSWGPAIARLRGEVRAQTVKCGQP